MGTVGNKSEQFVHNVREIYDKMLICQYGDTATRHLVMFSIYKNREAICKYYDDPGTNDIPPKEQFEIFKAAAERFAYEHGGLLAPSIWRKLRTMKRIPNAYRIASIVNAKEFADFVHKYMKTDFRENKRIGRLRYHKAILNDLTEMDAMAIHLQFLVRAKLELEESKRESWDIDSELAVCNRYLYELADRIAANASLYAYYIGKDELLTIYISEFCYDFIAGTSLFEYLEEHNDDETAGTVTVFGTTTDQEISVITTKDTIKVKVVTRPEE